MTAVEIKAKELIEKYVNLPIDYFYTDTQDGQCIGSGCMTYKSAVKCAIELVKEMLINNPCLPVIIECDDKEYAWNEYWNAIDYKLKSMK